LKEKLKVNDLSAFDDLENEPVRRRKHNDKRPSDRKDTFKKPKQDKRLSHKRERKSWEVNDEPDENKW